MKRALSLFSFVFIAAYSAMAFAVPCPGVVVVLDRSGSMTSTLGGAGSKWDIANTAIESLMMKYGDKLPFGFVTFQDSLSCDDFSQEAVMDPKAKNGAAIVAKLATLSPGGGTNSGQGVKKGAELITTFLNADPGRPGGYIILITDGEPFCPGPAPAPQTDPAYTVWEIDKALQSNIKTFVVGFGNLPTSGVMAMDQMGNAGGAPCMGASCAGHSFFVADSAAGLDEALEAIQGQISGEFAMQCDDSCYSNGCPNAGEVCVQGKCKVDPCLQVGPTCAPGDYCLTDGAASGQCVKACLNACPAGQACDVFTGQCKEDRCATSSCPTGTVCLAGNCVSNDCPEAGCDPGLICYGGQCVDDPCRYVTCPAVNGVLTECVTGTGACVSKTGGNGTGGMRPRGGGCSASDGAATLATLLLIGGALVLVRRRQRA